MELSNGTIEPAAAVHPEPVWCHASADAIIKNKTFVFGSYEGLSGCAPARRSNTTVPTWRNVAEFRGSLSAFNAPDPHGSGLTFAPTLTRQPERSFTNSTIRSPFRPYLRGNHYPHNEHEFPDRSPTMTSRGLSIRLPLSAQQADRESNVAGTVLNFVKDASTGGDTDEYVVRVDQTINSKQTIFGRFNYWKLLSLAQDPFGTGLCKDRCAENTRSKSLAIGYNYAISPNTILNINASISRFHYLRDPINPSFDMTQEGWPSAYNALVPDIRAHAADTVLRSKRCLG